MDSRQKTKAKTQLVRLFEDPEILQIARMLLDQPLPVPNPQQHPVILYVFVRTLGMVSIIFGGASLVMGISFKWCAGLIYLGLLLLTLEPWFEPTMRGFVKAKIVLSTIFIIFAIAFTKGIVFLPSPLMITARDYNGDFPTGHQIAGIDWKPQYSDLQILFSNPTDHDYNNLDLNIGAGMYIAEARPMDDNFGVKVFNTIIGSDKITVSNRDSRGRVSYEPDTHTKLLSGGVKVWCPKLSKHTSFEIVLAVVTVPAAKMIPAPEMDRLLALDTHETDIQQSAYGDRQAATKIGVAGMFESVAQRPNRIHQIYPVMQQ